MVVLRNFLPPVVGVRHEEQHTTLYINDREVGKGTLYISETFLSWNKNDTRQGFSLEYPHISLHAISRDDTVHPRHCLYVMVDAKVYLPDEAQTPESNSDDDDDDDDDSDGPMTEMRFAPDDTDSLDAMFQAMSQCQSLHRVPQDSCSDAEEDIYEDAEEDEFEYCAGDAPPYILSAETVGENHNGVEAEEAMDVEAGQFEDAEEGL